MVIFDTLLHETQAQVSSTLAMLSDFYSKRDVLIVELHTNEVAARSLGQGLERSAVTTNNQRPR